MQRWQGSFMTSRIAVENEGKPGKISSLTRYDRILSADYKSRGLMCFPDALSLQAVVGWIRTVEGSRFT